MQESKVRVTGKVIVDRKYHTTNGKKLLLSRLIVKISTSPKIST